MPTASVGAPPVRDRMVVSPTSCAIWVSMSGVTAKPQLRDHLRRLIGGRCRSAPAGLFMAK